MMKRTNKNFEKTYTVDKTILSDKLEKSTVVLIPKVSKYFVLAHMFEKLSVEKISRLKDDSD
jgi:hypothetical protein